MQWTDLKNGVVALHFEHLDSIQIEYRNGGWRWSWGTYHDAREYDDLDKAKRAAVDTVVFLMEDSASALRELR